MKVTKIEAQVKSKGRYSIFIDNKFAFGISELGLIDSGLRVGAELAAAELESLKDEAKNDKLYNQLLSLIMRRPRSRWELEDYLKKKSVDEQAANELVDRLKEKGFVDDFGFAKRWVENRRLLKPTSRRKLEFELRQKRVSDNLIKQVLAEDETQDIDTLKEEVARKRRQTRYADETKLMRYLAGRGYRYDDIKRALSG